MLTLYSAYAVPCYTTRPPHHHTRPTPHHHIPSPPPDRARPRVGKENVIASDVKTSRSMLEGGPFAYLDVQDRCA